MAQIAIEEWAGSSPIYTRRMQKALRYAQLETRIDLINQRNVYGLLPLAR